MAAIMDGGVDEALLATGAVFHTGGCDKTGHPLMIFPTSQQSALTNMPASDLILLLSYMRRIVPAQQQPTGFTYLANLQSAGQKTITQLITCLNTIQMTADTEAQVHCLYVIKPKTSKNVKILEKLAGLKPSKKNPVKNLYQVHMLKDFASLHRSIDKVALTEEFGGHQQFNIASWVQFRLQVDKITTEVERCQSLLEESRDQMNILCELEIPAGLDESQPLLDSINSKYNAVMGQLQLEHVIDNCGSILDELNSPKVQTKYAQGDLLRELIKYTRTSQRELTEAREQLQMLWKQALARVVQACQLHVHQKNAKKILKWIGRNGKASIKELTQPVSDREQVFLLLDKVKVLTASIQDVQKEADYIQTDVEYMALQDLSEFSSSLKAIETMRAELDLFNISLSNSQDRLGSACTVFTNVAKVRSVQYPRCLL